MFVSQTEKRQAFAILRLVFKRLPAAGFTIDDITSPKTPDYNCAAYAAKVETKPWWPFPSSYYDWPLGLPRVNTVENFFRGFERLGFQRCASGDHQKGFEKIAIYVDSHDVPKHVARELGDGIWFSKLGNEQDIRHYTLEAVEKPGYGKAKYFMRKRLRGPSKWVRLRKRLAMILSGSKT